MLTTQDLAGRLVLLSEEGRREVLARLPTRNGEGSPLSERLDKPWYVHRGSLALDEDYDNTLPLVVDGDLTVRGTLDDASARAQLVILGDLRCFNLLTRQRLLVTGSLYCGGLIDAASSDDDFEVFGESLEARALVLANRVAALPDKRVLDYFHDESARDAPTGEADILAASLLRYVDEDDYELTDEDRRAGASVARVVPTTFEEMRDVMRRLPDVFSRPFDFNEAKSAGRWRLALLQPRALIGVLEDALSDPTRHLDLALSVSARPEDLESLATSRDAKVLTALASHPSTPPHVLAVLARHASHEVRAAVVHQPALPEETLEGLAADRDAHVRQQFSASAFAPEFFEQLARDLSADVRRAVASRVDLTDDARMRLLEDRDLSVKRRALRYLPPAPSWVERLLGTGDADLVAWAVDRRAAMTAADVWSANATALLDPRRMVRETWLTRLASRSEAMPFFQHNSKAYLEDESPMLRRFLAQSSREAGTLEALARDAEEAVRQAVFDNFAAPGDLLIDEARRLIDAGRPATHLVKNLRLPTIALRFIHEASAREAPLEPHPNMEASLILERAVQLRPDLVREPGFEERGLDAATGAGLPTLFAAWLTSENSYLQKAARTHPATPMEALLRHARRASVPELAELCLNPSLSFKSSAGSSLLQFLLNQDDEVVAVALASNPAVPMRVLREVAQRSAAARQRAMVTAWQVFGDVL